MKNLQKFPPNEEIYKFLEDCAKNGIGNNPRERPVNILANNYSMRYELAIEYQKEFYRRQRLKRSEK